MESSGSENQRTRLHFWICGKKERKKQQLLNTRCAGVMAEGAAQLGWWCPQVCTACEIWQPKFTDTSHYLIIGTTTTEMWNTMLCITFGDAEQCMECVSVEILDELKCGLNPHKAETSGRFNFVMQIFIPRRAGKPWRHCWLWLWTQHLCPCPASLLLKHTWTPLFSFMCLLKGNYFTMAIFILPTAPIKHLNAASVSSH